MRGKSYLSKSKYILGLQCSKLLWTHYNNKKIIPPPDEATQYLFDQGQDVGDWAKKQFTGGIEIPWNSNPEVMVQETQPYLSNRVPLFSGRTPQQISFRLHSYHLSHLLH